MGAPDDALIVHASTVAFEGRALIIGGPSGSGKSTLALELVGRGCDLISDDGTILSLDDGQLVASAPERIAGMIEVRGMGILRAPSLDRATPVAEIELGWVETDRLPERRYRTRLGQELRLFHRIEGPVFAAALMHYLRYGEVPT